MARLPLPALLGLLGCVPAPPVAADPEQEADRLTLEARALPAGEERHQRLLRCADLYGGLGTVLGGARGFTEEKWRALWKMSDILLEADPERLLGYFRTMDLRGLAPAWDGPPDGPSRWGYREKFETVRRRLEEGR